MMKYDLINRIFQRICRWFNRNVGRVKNAGQQKYKEPIMKTKKAISNIGVSILLGLIIMLASAQAAQSEYVNPALPEQDTAAYWLDRGGFFTTYGNYPAAIRAFEKCLELDPNNSEAYFNLGVAQAEMEDYAKAISNIDKAIFLSADNGRYYYGRAWVLMLSGQSLKALPDFQKAADLGNLDAEMYLKQLSTGADQ